MLANAEGNVLNTSLGREMALVCFRLYPFFIIADDLGSSNGIGTTFKIIIGFELGMKSNLKLKKVQARWIKI